MSCFFNDHEGRPLTCPLFCLIINDLPSIAVLARKVTVCLEADDTQFFGRKHVLNRIELRVVCCICTQSSSQIFST